MKAAEVFELTTHGGTSDFALAVEICEPFGPYCLIGGLAVNCYVEPVYTLDADFVVYAMNSRALMEELKRRGFAVQSFEHSLNAQLTGSDLRVQFTLDPRYEVFATRAEPREVLGVQVRVARLEDVVQGKLWAYSDPERRMTKRKKDELDLLRLAEKYPRLKQLYPAELQQQLGER